MAAKFRVKLRKAYHASLHSILQFSPRRIFDSVRPTIVVGFANSRRRKFISQLVLANKLNLHFLERIHKNRDEQVVCEAKRSICRLSCWRWLMTIERLSRFCRQLLIDGCFASHCPKKTEAWAFLEDFSSAVCTNFSSVTFFKDKSLIDSLKLSDWLEKCVIIRFHSNSMRNHSHYVT